MEASKTKVKTAITKARVKRVTTGTVCSESFTKEEQELLIVALYSKFNIKATLNKRISSSGIESLRMRISKKSIPSAAYPLRRNPPLRVGSFS